MKFSLHTFSVSLIAIAAATSQLQAQSNPPTLQASPTASMGGMADGANGSFAGYVPSASSGMYVGGSSGDDDSRSSDEASVTNKPVRTGGDLPALSDGNVSNTQKIEGFNEAVEQSFPMTPEMTRQYRDIYDQNQRALLERKEPEARVDAGFISLEPGEVPSEFRVSPGIASVIGFYDATGQPWPISQYVLGNGSNFQVVQLGEGANNVAVTPLTRFGWTNLVVVLEGQAKPVVMRVSISEESAHYRQDIQVMARGPNASENTAAEDRSIREAGSGMLLAALSGVDLPAATKSVGIVGVDARGWMIGEDLFLRSKHALLSPTWLESMSGPDGIRVYKMKPSSVALFSVDGTIVRADVALP